MSLGTPHLAAVSYTHLDVYKRQLLELIRLKEVVVEQDRHFGEIMITLVSEGSIGELY